MTLPGAVNLANQFPGCAITFDPNVFTTATTITPAALLSLKQKALSTSITGPTAGLTISGGTTHGVFQVSPGVTASISELTITQGSSSGDGGGILNDGVLTISDSTLTANTSASSGGAVSTEGAGAQLTVIDCTIVGNDAHHSGGGLEARSNVTLIADTLTGNTAAVNGGAVDNTFNGGFTITVQDTILAADSFGGGTDTGPEVAGKVSSSGNNLISEADGSTGWVGSDQTGTIASPLAADLGTLGSYGGPTQTISLGAGSPALNKGGTADYPGTTKPITTDQRGFALASPKLDIGSFQDQLSFAIVGTAASPTAGISYTLATTGLYTLSNTNPLFTSSSSYTETINWGDNTGTTSNLSHTYALSGSDTIIVTLQDSYGDVAAIPLGVTVGRQATTTTLALSTNQAAYNTPVTLTATVKASASGSLVNTTGTVKFLDGTSTVGISTLSGGTATLSYGFLELGSHNLTAQYYYPSSEATEYAGSSSGHYSLTAQAAKSSITVTGPSATTYGNAISLEASVTDQDGISPIGTVDFKDGTTDLGSTTGTFTNGVASLSLAAGSTAALDIMGPGPTITATFTPSNSTDYVGSSGSSTISVNKDTPAIAWSTPAAINYDTALSATQLDAAANSGPNAGKVSVAGTYAYTYNGTSIQSGYTGLPGGSDTLSVTFTPTDTTDFNSATGTVNLTVKPLAVGPGQLESYSSSPSSASASATYSSGTSVTLTEAFSATGAVPTGSVSFFDGTTNLGNATLANGTATLGLTSNLPVGTNTITAVYADSDGDFTAPANQPDSFETCTVIINGLTTTSVSASTTSPRFGDTVTFTATVTAPLGFAPNGTVEFFDGLNPLEVTAAASTVTLPTVSGGATTNTATISYTFSDVATHSIKAEYLPGSNSPALLASASNPALSITAQPETPTIAWSTPQPINYGTALSVTQLNAGARGVGGVSLAGTYAYTYNATSIQSGYSGLPAGPDVLSVTFTPTNSADYTIATGSATLTVNLATPTLSPNFASNFELDSTNLANIGGGGRRGSERRRGVTLESVGLTIAYYVGTYTSLSQLAGLSPVAASYVQDNIGNYTAELSFAGSADYRAASALANFVVGSEVVPTISLTAPNAAYSGSAYDEASATISPRDAGSDGTILEGVGLILTYYAGTTTDTLLSGAADRAGDLHR